MPASALTSLDLEPFDRINLGQTRVRILAERGESVDAEFESLGELTTGASHTQLRAGMEATRAAIALSRRERDVAFEPAMRAMQIEPGFVGGQRTLPARPHSECATSNAFEPDWVRRPHSRRSTLCSTSRQRPALP